ncbi:serine hydrolase domain-containing protein [Kineococcus xinjiangensis]|nr:serine hydrolase domain-containing protein [Kineococcus xinjiangensis]
MHGAGTGGTRWRARAAVAAALAASLLACSAAPPGPAAGPALPGIDAELLQESLDRLAATGAQGVIARITRDGQVLELRAGTARHDGAEPVPHEARFRIGSITKVFVATVVLQLAAEGRLSLDEPVSRHLPGLLPDGDRITARMLLQHTSGLVSYTDHVPIDPPALSSVEEFERLRHLHHAPEDLVALATSRPLEFEPGTRFEYSNTGYVVLGMLVEAVTGKPYGRVLEERVIAPLGLRATSVPGGRESLPSPHAHGYERIAGQVVDVTELDPSIAWAAGEVVSTTADLDRFLAALLGGELLPAEQLRQMRRSTPVSPAYGLGLQRDTLGCGAVVEGHSGSIPGFASLALSAPHTRTRLELSLTTAPDAGAFRGQQELLEEVFCG